MVSLNLYSDNDPADGAPSGCGSCQAGGAGGSKCGNGLEKIYKSTAIRFGYMKQIGEFTYPEGMRFTCGASVVIQTTRGIEIGEQVSLGCTGCDKHVSREQIKAYIAASGADTYRFASGRIHREATPDDLAEAMRLRDRTLEMKRFAQECAHRCVGRGQMKIVECEYLLGGERAIFYFMAEGRVDFRVLVRELSHEFQTRIQMHQVGARDEARLLADFETCGREVCCKVFLKTLKPVSMRMAKLQRSTLDPTKVSGRCGRLKCCLRYEHQTYEELDKKLPKHGEKVHTSSGYGTVVDRQILTQLIQLELVGEGGRTTVAVEDVIERRLNEFPPKPSPPPEPEPPDSSGAERPKPQRPRRRQRTGNQEAVRREPTSKTEPARPAAGPSRPGVVGDMMVGKSDRGSQPRPPSPKRRRGRRRRGRGGGSVGGGVGGSGGRGTGGGDP